MQFHDHTLVDQNDYTPNGDETSFYSLMVPDVSGSTDGLSEMSDYRHLSGYQDEYFPVSLTLSHSYSSCNIDEYYSESYDHQESWRGKPVKQWVSNDVLEWINSEAVSMGICCTDIQGYRFRKLDGFRLMEMNEADFEKCDEKYGKILYQKLKSIISDQEQSSLVQLMTPNHYSYEQTYTILDTPSENVKYNENRINIPSDAYEADLSQPSSSPEDNRQYCFNNPIKRKKNQVNIEAPIEGERKGPGRPKMQRKKKKPDKKVGRLWEFIRDLLKNRDYCPKIICWENHDEGMFRFVHSDQVARLWGDKKHNPDMNYEKLSRAMRYYYRSEVLQAVLGRRLVYKFGPNAVGWKCDNPNFKN